MRQPPALPLRGQPWLGASVFFPTTQRSARAGVSAEPLWPGRAHRLEENGAKRFWVVYTLFKHSEACPRLGGLLIALYGKTLLLENDSAGKKIS